jgi:5-methylcytosine-specific restriction protein B
LLDAALRRRFAFVELMPDAELLSGATVGKLPLDAFLLTLNRRIVRHVGREKQIGHSFFLADGEPVTDPDDFSRRFLGEVLPLLQEYAYEDYRLLKDLIGDALVDVEAQTLKTLVLHEPVALVEALAQSFQDMTSDDGA